MDELGAVKIWSVQANSLWRVNRGDKNAFLDLKDAYLNESLFLKYMMKHGFLANKQNRVKDIVLLKFDYGVKETEDHAKMTAAELRERLYKDGVDITWDTCDKTGAIVASDTIHYKMLMRSPGKAKKGECYFIRDNLLEVARNYLTMGLYDKIPDDNAPIVELSAYDTLVTATAMDYIHIPLKNILIIKDQEVESRIPAVVVKSVYNQETGRKECMVSRDDKNAKVVNVLWDGMGLIDESIFPSDRGMDGFIYCRSHFFKSCLFRGNIVQFLKDYYKEEYETESVKDMFGNKIKVKDIRVIITDKSIKWIKFTDMMGSTPKEAYQYYKKILKKYKEEFAIVKTAHASKWGDLQRSSYQINNSLPCTDTETLQKIASTSVDYCNNLKTDHRFFMEHLKRTAQSYSTENVWIALDEINSNFKNTKYFKSKKNSVISKFKNERLKLGKLLYHGDNLTLCGNPLALIKNAVEVEGWKNENCFTVQQDYIECYTRRFSSGVMLAGFRNPHNSPNNILSLKNVYPEELIKYFPYLGKNVLVVNGISTDVQARANGMDYDTDSFFVTDQPEIAMLAKSAYVKYLTIINDIPLTAEKKQTYCKNLTSYALMDNNIAASQYAIGLSSNIAQLALSYYYDLMSKNKENEEDLKSLEDIFIICSVLAQVAIDSAKRTFDIDVSAELKRLKRSLNQFVKKYDIAKYPKFYADIQNKLKNYYVKSDEVDETISCPMQIIYDILDKEIIDLRCVKDYSTSTYDMAALFSGCTGIGKDSKQFKKIISYVEEYEKTVSAEDKTAEDYSKNVKIKFDECIKKINKLKIKQQTMVALVKYAFTNSSKICDRILVVLFNSDKDNFLKCFISDQNLDKIPEKIA